jgi:predicted metal-dependent hydrolase
VTVTPSRIAVADAVLQDLEARLSRPRRAASMVSRLPMTAQEHRMRVRRPHFDLVGVSPHWAPNHEFAHHVNASGIIPSAVEPFLIKVFRRAKAQLDPVADAQLISDIDIFNRQEAQHYKSHELFNEIVASNGYPEIRLHDERLKAEYDEMSRTRSLEWLLGYCEGFESLASSGAEMWVDAGWGEYLDGADPQVVNVWTWHLAEEFEHRMVAYDLYHRLATGSLEEVHQKRVELFQYAVDHIRSHTAALRSYLLEVDRAAMTDAEREASIAREQAVDDHFAAGYAGVLRVLEPTYTPAALPVPVQLERVLSSFA